MDKQLMLLRLVSTCRFILPALILICFFCTQVEAVYSKSFDEQDDIDLRKPHTFSILACVTWWSHDAVGYHPAMCLFLENISGHQIGNVDASTGRASEEIPFQGRFTDIRSGEVTVAREYKRAPIRSHERFPVFLRGPQSYDLPIDSTLWPSIECKAMCRVNDIEPEDLFLGRLAHMTMSDEDAQAQLVSQAGRSPLLIRPSSGNKGKLTRLQMHAGESLADEPDIKTLPLRAKQGTVAGVNATPKIAGKSLNNSVTNNKSVNNNGLPKLIPAVGDDFYVFEKLYGPAIEFQAAATAGDLTWTHYKSTGLITDVYVGSRNASKADVVILGLSSNSILKDKDILLLGKQMARSNKSDPITPLSHSVRYSSAGRFEFMTTAIRECRILSFKLSDSAVLAVSRLPGDIEAAMTNYGKRVNFLKFIETD